MVLDTCVLMPPVLCDCLLSVAKAGFFRPLWSDRILAEWAHASARRGFDASAMIDAATAAFSAARQPAAPGIEARLHLPDDNDNHVLAIAIAAGADVLITWNAADFPRGTLAAEGIQRRDPDGFLWQMWSHDPVRAGAALEQVRARAEAMAGTPVALCPLLKRAKLTRLARALA